VSANTKLHPTVSADGTPSLRFCSTERTSIGGHTTKWCRSSAACLAWQAGVNQQPSCSKAPTRVCSQMVIVVICCCLLLLPGPTHLAQKEGEVGALQGPPPKHVQGPGPEPSRGDRDSMSSQTRRSILPVPVNVLCLPSFLVAPANRPGWSPGLLACRHAMCPNGSCGNGVHCALRALVDSVFHGEQTKNVTNGSQNTKRDVSVV